MWEFAIHPFWAGFIVAMVVAALLFIAALIWWGHKDKKDGGNK